MLLINKTMNGTHAVPFLHGLCNTSSSSPIVNMININTNTNTNTNIRTPP